MGAQVLPHITKDNTDRNRTSPFAFTGNKFEFRMPGSSVSVANANIVLNTAVAEILSRMSAELDGLSGDALHDKLTELLKKTLIDHKRILFNGNGYTDEWIAEAEKRGLPNLKSLPDAMPEWISEKSVKLFTSHQIFTKEEIESRYEILLENYSKSINIESLTMQEMVRKDLTSGLIAYEQDLTNEILQKKEALPGAKAALETGILETLDETSAQIAEKLDTLKKDTHEAEGIEDVQKQADFYEKKVLADMNELRVYTDQAEALIPDEYLDYPTYGQMLFSLR